MIKKKFFCFSYTYLKIDSNESKSYILVVHVNILVNFPSGVLFPQKLLEPSKRRNVVRDNVDIKRTLTSSTSIF